MRRKDHHGQGFLRTLPQRRAPTAAMTAKEKQLAAVSAAAGKPAARLPLLKQLGPGLITGAADDDPSGIASYSQAGAQFGYGMLWSVFFTLPLMAGIQIVSARIGRVTGHGLAANIRDHFPAWLLNGVVALLVIANTINIAADLGAMGNALQLLVGGHSQISVVFFALVAVTLHAQGVTDIQTSEQAAEALRPLAGEFAFLLFTAGIVGTGLLAVPVLAGSAAYAVAESRRWPIGLGLPLLEARGFYAIVTAATLIGVALDFTDIDPIKALVWSAIINGVIAVPIMAVMLRLAVMPDVMGPFVIKRRLRALGWLATAVMAAVASQPR